MANPEHLATLQQGVEQWNKWREGHPGVKPSLRKAVVSGASLVGANLYGADLRWAALTSTNLSGAYLYQADLRWAALISTNLSGANLVEAYLSFADLSRADLAGANLERANLSGTNLNGAYLNGAYLNGAYLNGAYLNGADLKRANFKRASLNGAYLNGADLSGSDLKRANLMGADLMQTNLRGANLAETDFSEAKAFATIFANVDLSDAKGLETTVHLGPSTVGIDTIYKSRGKIPEVFLRGCGLADWEIETAKLYDPSLSSAETTDIAYQLVHLRNNQPFQYFSCFISYSTRDQEFAERLHADLQAKGVRCWFAPHDIKGGRKIHEQIDEAIRLHDRLLLILSEESMKSDWVRTEIAKARKREKEDKRVLFPVRLVTYEAMQSWEYIDSSGKDLAEEIRQYFIPDFSKWKEHDSYQAALGRLVGDLKAVASG